MTRRGVDLTGEPTGCRSAARRKLARVAGQWSDRAAGGPAKYQRLPTGRARWPRAADRPRYAISAAARAWLTRATVRPARATVQLARATMRLARATVKLARVRVRLAHAKYRHARGSAAFHRRRLRRQVAKASRARAIRCADTNGLRRGRPTMRPATAVFRFVSVGKRPPEINFRSCMQAHMKAACLCAMVALRSSRAAYPTLRALSGQNQCQGSSTPSFSRPPERWA